MKEKQVHVLIGCADARDQSQIQLDAIDHISEKFRKEREVEVELHVIRAAVRSLHPMW